MGFEDLLTRIDDLTSLEKVSRDEILRLRAQFPDLPGDYLQFLMEIGHGNLGSLAIYPSPIDPVRVYTKVREPGLQGIVLFGDDMQGFCYGFDLRAGCRVVEVDPRGRIDRTVEASFGDFLRSFL